MPKIHAYDRKGNVIQMQCFDNFFFPMFPFDKDSRTHIQDIIDLPIRDDDVLIWAYAKTGNHWLWEMIQMLNRGNTEYDKFTKENHTLDFMTPKMLEEMPSPRTLNSHFLFQHLPKGFFQTQHKIIVIHRDPKDVAVSWYNHMVGTNNISPYNGEFSDYLEMYLEGTVAYGSYFDYTRHILDTLEANPHINALQLFYEDMKEDTARELRRVQDFLGLPASDDLCKAVADACHFNKLKQVIDNRPDPLRGGWKEGFGMCRKGIVGDWMNWFSEEDQAYFDRIWRKKLAGTSFAERYR